MHSSFLFKAFEIPCDVNVDAVATPKAGNSFLPNLIKCGDKLLKID